HIILGFRNPFQGGVAGWAGHVGDRYVVGYSRFQWFFPPHVISGGVHGGVGVELLYPVGNFGKITGVAVAEPGLAAAVHDLRRLGGDVPGETVGADAERSTIVRADVQVGGHSRRYPVVDAFLPENRITDI